MPLEIPLILEVTHEILPYINLLKIVKDFFHQQRNYTIKADKITYLNETTGVYFSIHLPTDKYFVNLLPFPSGTHISLLFSIPVGRPAAFILEALEEIDKIQARFNTKTYDYQESDVQPYDKASLSNVWYEMNNTLCKIIQSHNYTTQYWTLPGKIIEKCWRWNYDIAARTKLLPSLKIYYSPNSKEYTPSVSPFVVWKMSSKAALPMFVEHVVVAVDGFNNTIILFKIKMQKLIHKMREFEGYYNISGASNSLEILDTTPPEPLMQYVLSKKTINERCQFVKEEQILEEELLQR